jgi:hypothetical protein
MVMKLVEQTSSRLKLQANHHSEIVLGALMGVALVLGGLAAIGEFAKVTTLTCDRLEPKYVKCELQTAGILDREDVSFPPNYLLGATVQEIELEDNTVYRVLLQTKNGDFPLTPTASSGAKGKEIMATQIETYLQEPNQKSLLIKSDRSWVAYGIGGLFVFLGGGLIILVLSHPLRTTYVFDKQTDQIEWKKQHLFNAEIQQWALHEIEQVIFNIDTDSDGDESYSVSLKLRSGKELPLQLISVAGKGNYEKIADSIKRLLASS